MVCFRCLFHVSDFKTCSWSLLKLHLCSCRGLLNLQEQLSQKDNILAILILVLVHILYIHIFACHRLHIILTILEEMSYHVYMYVCDLTILSGGGGHGGGVTVDEACLVRSCMSYL